MPVGKVLIANRGEIAVRILRACRDLGLPAVVAYSEADRDTLPVRLADEAICIGPAEARKSYLNQPAVISAAMITGCDAVHPGYGFLSEDATFARRARATSSRSSVRGPRCSSGFASKYAVRRMLAANGLTVPGSRGIVTDLRDARPGGRGGLPGPAQALRRGRGRGMRLVRSPREMETSLPLARSRRRPRSATTASTSRSGSRSRATSRCRCSSTGTATASTWGAGLQRPAPPPEDHRGGPVAGHDDAARERLRDLAIRSVVAAGYESAGTLEFLLDGDGNFYFIEINCRIQVEHPVTEMLTGVDLIAEQIRLAAGEPLSLHQDAATSAATRSSSASTPRTRATTSHRRPARSSRCAARRPGRPRRHAPVRRLRGPAVLRQPARQADRVGRRAGDRPGALAAGARRVRVRRREDQPPFHRGIIDNDAFLDARVSTNLLDRVGPAAFVPS